MTTEPESSCLDDTESDFISMAAAREAIFDAAPRLTHEQVGLHDALERVLAIDAISPLDVPRRDNSAMDGFAVASDGGADSGSRFREIGVALAGVPFKGEVAPGECVRITTGAWVPQGADAVIIQERCRTDPSSVQSLDAIEPGQNVRRRGEDVRAGQVLLPAGSVLLPAQLGLLGSVGVLEVAVSRRPRVAYFSTGNEVQQDGEPLGEGNIFDSNRHTVSGMTRRAGAQLLDLGVVADDPDAMRATFEQILGQTDVIITSGGVSVGEADFIKPTLATLGETHYWKVAVRPGRPFTFGRIGDVLFFGLPGNPVAAMVMYYQLVQPALRYLMSSARCLPLELPAITQSRLRKRPGRMEFQRGVLSHGSQGELRVTRTGMQGSGILSSMAEADCFIVMQEQDASAEPGDTVSVQPFHGLV